MNNRYQNDDGSYFNILLKEALETDAGTQWNCLWRRDEAVIKWRKNKWKWIHVFSVCITVKMTFVQRWRKHSPPHSLQSVAVWLFQFWFTQWRVNPWVALRKCNSIQLSTLRTAIFPLLKLNSTGPSIDVDCYNDNQHRHHEYWNSIIMKLWHLDLVNESTDGIRPWTKRAYIEVDRQMNTTNEGKTK